MDGTQKKTVIKTSGLRKVYRIGKERVVALKGIDIEVFEGEICCLLGTSGSGKSTLLNMLAGLEKPTRGEISILGERIDKMNEKKLAIFRQKNLGFVFQSYNLLPNLSAVENVSLPLEFQGVSKKVRDKKAIKMLKLVGLADRMKHRPTQMSGGQQQRVGIARAFVGSPKIVFADEPTGNLDSKTTDEVMNMIVDMIHKNHQTMVIVTHEQSIAKYADRVFFMLDGEISNITNNFENKNIYENAGEEK